MSADVCYAPTDVDMLIDPEQFPCKSADFDVEAIRTSADRVQAMGEGVAEQMSGISTTWAGLQTPGTYEGPEQQQVYDLMTPAVTSADGLESVLVDAATLLRTYAGELEDVQGRLATLEADAREFRASVINGVEVVAAESNDAGFGDYAAWAFDWVPGVDQRTVTVPWNQDSASRDRNAELLELHAGILAEISTAATTCSNGLKGLITNSCVSEDVAYTAEVFLDTSVPMPWGSPVDEDRNCPESVGHGVANFGVGLWEGGATILGFDVENGYSWSLGGLGDGLWGVVDVVGSLAITVVTAPAVVWYTDNKDSNAVAGWLYDRAVTGTTAAGGLIGFDMTEALDGGNGWHRWENDPWATGTESVLNVGTFFIPVGAVARGSTAAARASRLLAGATEFIVPGGSWLLNGGARAVGLGRILDDIPFRPTRPGGPNPLANLVDAVDDLPTPVSDAVFPRTPELPETPSGSQVPDTTHPHLPDQPGSGTHPLGDNAGTGTPDGAGTPGSGQPGAGGHGQPDSSGHGQPDPGTAPDPQAEQAARTADPQPQPDIDVPESTARTDAVEARADAVETRADAVAERAAAIERLQEMGYDVSPSDLTVKKIEATIDRLTDDLFDSDLSGPEFDAQYAAITDLRAAALAERASYVNQVDMTEGLGDTGLVDALEAQGADVVIAPEQSSSGRFDGVGYQAATDSAPGQLIVGEAKGGSARLSENGRLLEDGSRAAQGSTLYFNEIWRRDPALQQLLQDRPDIAAGIADGSIEIRYQLVHTAADGTVTVSDLPLDPAYLDLGLDQ
ncbi:hypothetical protein [Pseudactinotalea terrae]|uniref:hypothetical protein n=1 Tax=Pseudactinotalea terrae TaxID=1743262 RepID=UPI0012E2F9BE|nr:hypothetical protein [Pseudactinotalea terrae]